MRIRSLFILYSCGFNIFAMEPQHNKKKLGIYLKNNTPVDYFISRDTINAQIFRSNDIIFLHCNKTLSFFYQKKEINKKNDFSYLINGLKTVVIKKTWNECKSLKIVSGYYYLNQREKILYFVEPIDGQIPTLYWLAMHAISADTLKKIPKIPTVTGRATIINNF